MRDLEFISQPISDECFLPFEVHLHEDVSDLYLQKRNFARLLITCLLSLTSNLQRLRRNVPPDLLTLLELIFYCYAYKRHRRRIELASGARRHTSI